MNIDQIDRKKKYYQKHRSKILKSLKEKRNSPNREPIVFRLAETFQRISSLLKQEIEKLLLAFLVLSCTGFLVIESARTLCAIEGHGAILKALLCELVLVGISMLVVSTRRMQILRLVVLFGISALTLLNTIEGPLSQLSQAKQSVRSKVEEVSILNRTLEQKRTLLARYLATNRISGARRLESEIAPLSERLTQVIKDQAEQKPESILTLGFGITVLFRLVIMAANIVFSNRLGQLFRQRSVPTPRESVVTPAKLFLVRT